MEEQPSQAFLPEDFVFKEILTRLPVKSLVRFKGVSKSWLARISNDSSFISAHLDRQLNRQNKFRDNIIRAWNWEIHKYTVLKLYLLGGPDDSKLVEIDTSYMTQVRKVSEKINRVICLVGSCNDLVCIKLFYSDGPCMLLLWNPATREFKYLPEPTLPPIPDNCPQCDHRMMEYCFGFDEESKDYKIVRVEELDTDDENIASTGVGKTLDIQIFTKSSCCWRQLKGLSGCELLCSREEGVAVDGTMNWAVLRGEEPAKGSLYRVLSVDLRDEEVRELDGPASRVDEDYVHFALVTWKRSLGAVMVTAGMEYQFWLRAKNEDGNNNGDVNKRFCWTKMHNIIKPSVGRWTFGVVFRDQFKITHSESKESFLYDPVSQEKREIDKEFTRFHFYDVYDYVPSLVSPN